MISLDHLPQRSEKNIAVHVTSAAEGALRRGHPWVFDESIERQSRQGQPGDLAVVFDSKRHFLAVGLYDPDSPIRVKVLQHHKPAVISQQWFTDRLEDAAVLRTSLEADGTTGYRFVHGENDRLPALIVDRYAETLVLKLYSAAWLPHLKAIIGGLQDVQPFNRLVLRLSRNIADNMAQYGFFDGQVLIGEPPSGPVVFQENGLSFQADVRHGHKTGFFFDQRDNRAAVRKVAAGKRVLDVFAYSGGFSVYAAAGGATSVTSLDVSEPALRAAEANFALNYDNPYVRAAEHITMAGDAFEKLSELYHDGYHYDMVIIDPPSFAKRAAEVPGALAAYHRLVRLGLNVLVPNGLLVMASCSSRVTRHEFVETVLWTAQEAGRPLLDVEQFGHAIDHPIRFPEGEYLKCVIGRSS